MKKLSLIVPIIVFLAAGCNSVSQPQAQNTPSNTQPTLPAKTQTNSVSQVSTTGWQTYTNTQFGFEFKYPADWKIVNEKKVDNQTLLTLGFASPEENAIGKYTANLTIYSGDTFNNNLNDLVKVTEQVFGKMDNVTIAGEPGKKIIARSSGGTKKLSLKSAFIHDGLGYQISSTGWITDENKAVAEVDALLSTFKFTK